MSETFSMALSKIERRRLIMRSQLERKKEEIYTAIPEVLNIQNQINRCGADMALANLQRDTERATQLREEMILSRKKLAELLVENGYSEDDLTLKHYCDICGDTGFVNGVACQCVKAEAAKLRQKQLSALSPAPNADFSQFSLDYYPKEPTDLAGGGKIVPYNMMSGVLEYCQKYAEGFTKTSNSLFMIGSSGLGKTHLACSIAKVVMEKGYSVMYASSQSLFSQVERNRYSDSDLLKDILDCDLFILDDLGAEAMTAYSLGFLYNVINTRMIEEKPCIITSNFVSQLDLRKKYPEKITSRLLGSYQRLYFYGKDIRIIKSNKK